MRQTVDDNKVFNIWACSSCNDEVEVTPDWYQDNGTPTCGICCEDMYYVMTEIEE